MKPYKILSPCAILGYGFPEESFTLGIKEKPDAIVVDAGSTDAGPHKLGLGIGIVSRQAYKKDLQHILKAGAQLKIPVIIGSCGGSGGKPHLSWTKEIVDEIMAEEHLHSKIALIHAVICKETVSSKLEAGEVEPLGISVKPLTPKRFEPTTEIEAQMGHEPIIKALEGGANIILCGRAYDPAPFAAAAIHNGCDMAYAYHAGKVLECAALCAEPGSAKDCMLGIILDDGFIVRPLSPDRRCTTTSVAAHTFYEKDHPYILHGPGIELNLQHCTFTQLEEGAVKVSGSKITVPETYYIKLEGAMIVGYRTFVIAGVRDEKMIASIDCIQAEVVEQVKSYYRDIDPQSYMIHFFNYGKDGVLGELEPVTAPSHELGVVLEVLADTQDKANMVCATARSTLLHYGYAGRKSTAGNLAFPFAPSDIPFGPVCEFSVYHLMKVANGLESFPVEYYEV